MATKYITIMMSVIKYFCVLCIGAGVALIIEYGFATDFVLIVGLSGLLLALTQVLRIKIKKEKR